MGLTLSMCFSVCTASSWEVIFAFTMSTKPLLSVTSKPSTMNRLGFHLRAVVVDFEICISGIAEGHSTDARKVSCFLGFVQRHWGANHRRKEGRLQHSVQIYDVPRLSAT